MAGIEHLFELDGLHMNAAMLLEALCFFIN